MSKRSYAVVAGGPPVLEITTDDTTTIALDGDELGKFTRKQILDGAELGTPEGWTLRVQKIGSTLVVFRDGKPLPAVARTLQNRTLAALIAAGLVAAMVTTFGVVLKLKGLHYALPMLAGGVAILALAVLAWRGIGSWPLVALFAALGSLASFVAVQLLVTIKDPMTTSPIILGGGTAIVLMVNARGPQRALAGKRVKPPLTGVLRVLMLLGISIGVIVLSVVLIFADLFSRGNDGEMDDDERREMIARDRAEYEKTHPSKREPWMRFVTLKLEGSPQARERAAASIWQISVGHELARSGMFVTDKAGRILDDWWSSSLKEVYPAGKHPLDGAVTIACPGTKEPIACTISVTPTAGVVEKLDFVLPERYGERDAEDKLEEVLVAFVGIALGLPGDYKVMTEYSDRAYESEVDISASQLESLPLSPAQRAQVDALLARHAATLDRETRMQATLRAKDFAACLKFGAPCANGIEEVYWSLPDRAAALAAYESLAAAKLVSEYSIEKFTAGLVDTRDLPETLGILRLARLGQVKTNAEIVNAYLDDQRPEVAALARESMAELAKRAASFDAEYAPDPTTLPKLVRGTFPVVEGAGALVGFAIPSSGVPEYVAKKGDHEPDPKAVAAIAKLRFEPSKDYGRRISRVARVPRNP